MKGDYSRFTDDPASGYTRVRKPQGRVNTDAEWNEQVDIALRRVRTEAEDVIGLCGVPRDSGNTRLPADGFRIGPGDDHDLTISPGRIYVDGIQCRLSKPSTFLTQPDLPAAAAAAECPEPPIGSPVLPRDLVYLDVWERPIDEIDDDRLVDPALGVPTSNRTQVVRQVRATSLIELGDDAGCDARPELWPATTSLARLTTKAEPTDSPDDPCLVASGGGYRGLENRLYRVEIHRGGDPDDPDPEKRPTFKWSRDNGSVVYKVKARGKDHSKLEVADLGRDLVTTLRVGDLVEFVDDDIVLSGRPGILARVEEEGIDEVSREVTLTRNIDPFDPDKHPRLIRWDHADPAVVPAGDSSPGHPTPITESASPYPTGWIEIEDGIWIRFHPNGTYRAGDYWAFAARAATGKIEELTEAPPQGIHHHCCPLALVSWVTLPPPITLVETAPDSEELLLVDSWSTERPAGEEVSTFRFVLRDVWVPDIGWLSAEYVAKQLNDALSVNGARVAVELPRTIAITVPAADHDNLLTWLTDAPIEAPGNAAFARIVEDCRRTFAPLTALTASDVLFDNRVCEFADAATVQEALDELCRSRGEPERASIQIEEIQLVSTSDSLRNDSSITPGDLAEGIRIVCERPIVASSVKAPACYVTLYVPYPQPIGPTGQLMTVGFLPLILNGTPELADAKTILWAPQPVIQEWVAGQMLAKLSQNYPGPIPIQLTLRGGFIWSNDGQEVYVDGGVFGVEGAPDSAVYPGGRPTTAIGQYGDGQPGGDLVMWFWLVEHAWASIEVTKTADITEATPGDVVTFTVRITNTSPEGAGWVEVRQLVDPNVPNAGFSTPLPVRIDEGESFEDTYKWTVPAGYAGVFQNEFEAVCVDQRGNRLPAAASTVVEVKDSAPARPVVAALACDPDNLYVHGSSMLEAVHMLKALYDGPFDERGNEYQPVILDAMPTPELELVPVAAGDPYVLNGRIEIAESPTRAEQMTVVFHLRQDLFWADGMPVTAEDSRLSFELASKPETPTSKLRTSRTDTYEVVDDYTIQWVGLPGWTDSAYCRNLWTPLPKHVLEASAPGEIAQSDFGRQPLGYGPFAIESWSEGDTIRLQAADGYFRAGEGLPYASEIQLMIVPESTTLLLLLQNGDVDIALTGCFGIGDLPRLRYETQQSNLMLHVQPANAQVFLMFNLDDPHLRKLEVRKAIALAIDRPTLCAEALHGETVVGHTFVPPGHPSYCEGEALERYDFNLDEALQLIGESEFDAELLVPAGDSTLAAIAEVIKQNLSEIGVRISIVSREPRELFARGEEAPLHGHNFSMALVSHLASVEPPVELFLSEEVSEASNGWGGANVAGFDSPAFDKHALAALSEMDQMKRQACWDRAQAVLSRRLPAVPLFQQVKIAVTSPKVGGLSLDPSHPSELDDAEKFLASE